MKPTCSLLRITSMLLVLFFSGTPRFARPQETPQPPTLSRITFEESGRFRSLIRELGKRTGCRIPIAPDLQDKDVSVVVKDAGFFEVLDALCRKHGGASYFGIEGLVAISDELSVAQRTWTEVPTSYQGHFKIVISHFLRVQGGSIDGEGAGVDLGIVLLAPPWVRVTYSSGTRMEWTLEEARGADGKDLLNEGKERGYREFAYLDGERTQTGNFSSYRFSLRDFELKKGLSVLSGKVAIKAAASKIVRVPLESGKSVEIAGGTLTVDSISELKKVATGTIWRIALTVKSKEGDAIPPRRLRNLFEGTVRHEGRRGDWGPKRFYWRGQSFDIDSSPVASAPAWIEFRIREDEQTINVPFRFKDVTFERVY